MLKKSSKIQVQQIMLNFIRHLWIYKLLFINIVVL
jgi:hypothetical protein